MITVEKIQNQIRELENLGETVEGSCNRLGLELGDENKPSDLVLYLMQLGGQMYGDISLGAVVLAGLVIGYQIAKAEEASFDVPATDLD